MFTKNALIKTIFVVISIISLAACASQAVQTPAATAVPVSGATQAPAAAQGSSFDGLSKGLDNTKLARIRTVSGVIGLNLDVYINGLPVVNGGKMLQNIGDGSYSGWIYVNPGSYQVALVPNGKTVDQAIFTPAAVDAAAGHRYTVAAMGQLADKDIKPLIVDETALETSLGQKATGGIYIEINTLKGADSIGVRHDGKVLGTTKYGQAGAIVCPSYNQQLEEIFVTTAGNPDQVIASGNMYCHVGVSAADIYYGDYPNNVQISNDSQGTSEANVLDYLAEFNNTKSYTDDGHLLTFNTLLAAIDKAGMRDLFSNKDPYFFIAPTDEAFSALPKDQLDALLNDPQQLTKLLKTGFMTGYYPSGSLSGATYGAG